MGKSDSGSNRAILLLLILLAVPIVAYAAGRGIEWKLDSTLQSALSKQFPDKAAEVSQISMLNWCSQTGIRRDADIAEVCSLSDNVQLMKSGAVIAAVVGIALLIAIKVAGQLSKGNRLLLLLFFAPGLHITMLVLALLMVLHAALGMAAIYYGESTLIGRVHYGVVLGLGVGALFGVFAILRAQFSMIRKATTIVFGKKLVREKQPKLWQFVDELADRMGAQRPEAIVAGMEPNFYVTEANVVCLDGKLTGRTMFVSLPLCRILRVNEMKAVLGHELAHYKGLDTRFSRRFYPIYRGVAQGLANIASGLSEKGGAGQVVLLPAFATLSYFLDSFSESEKAISRERELAADKEAASIDNGRDLATALVKLHALSDVWPSIRQKMKLELRNGKQFANVSVFFSEVVKGITKDDIIKGVSEQGPPHPTDTHPPLSQRLKNLNLTLEDVSQDSADVSPAMPAIAVVENLEDLEKELTDSEYAMMIKTGEARLAPARAGT